MGAGEGTTAAAAFDVDEQAAAAEAVNAMAETAVVTPACFAKGACAGDGSVVVGDVAEEGVVDTGEAVDVAAA